MRKKLIKVLGKPITAIAMSVIVGFIIGALVLLIAGYNPFELYGIMFKGMVEKPKYIAQILINSMPIMLTGLSVAFAYKTGLFNIGAEGQYLIGGVTAALIGYLVPLPPIIHPIAIILLAFLFGGVFGGIAGWLKSKFGIHEVISTIMLNWIAFYLNNFLVNTKTLKKEGTLSAHEILPTARIRFLTEWKKSTEGRDFIKNNDFWGDILKTDAHLGIFIAIILCIVIWYFLNHTSKGFELRAVGAGRDAAEFAGINVKKNTVKAMFIAGGLAAMAGAMQIMGTNSFRIGVLGSQEGYGWDGISVALLASNNPIGVIVSAIMFSGLKYGGGTIQSKTGAPSEVIDIMVGVIVFCIAISSVFPMIANKLKEGEVSHE